jgi:hypothetical protein
MTDKVIPIHPDGYADHLSGNWDDVPDWAIARINFLEQRWEWENKARCPQMNELCPDVPDMSCFAVKHCFHYLCKGTCGHDEIYVTEDDKKLLKSNNHF